MHTSPWQYNSPIDRAIIFFSGFGVIFILSTMDLIGLNVVFAVTEAGICHLLLFAVDMPSKTEETNKLFKNYTGA